MVTLSPRPQILGEIQNIGKVKLSNQRNWNYLFLGVFPLRALSEVAWQKKEICKKSLKDKKRSEKL